MPVNRLGSSVGKFYIIGDPVDLNLFYGKVKLGFCCETLSANKIDLCETWGKIVRGLCASDIGLYTWGVPEIRGKVS